MIRWFFSHWLRVNRRNIIKFQGQINLLVIPVAIATTALTPPSHSPVANVALTAAMILTMDVLLFALCWTPIIWFERLEANWQRSEFLRNGEQLPLF